MQEHGVGPRAWLLAWLALGGVLVALAVLNWFFGAWPFRTVVMLVMLGLVCAVVAAIPALWAATPAAHKLSLPARRGADHYR